MHISKLRSCLSNSLFSNIHCYDLNNNHYVENSQKIESIKPNLTANVIVGSLSSLNPFTSGDTDRQILISQALLADCH